MTRNPSKFIGTVFLTFLMTLLLSSTAFAYNSNAGTELTAASGELAPGNYYLTGDITLDKTFSMLTSGTYEICLNGYDINIGTANYSALQIGRGNANDNFNVSIYGGQQDDGASGTITGSGTQSGVTVIASPYSSKPSI